MNGNATERVKAEARRLGFDRVGIARVRKPPEAERLREWLSREFHGGMKYLEREPERRMDPQKILPGARSIVCVQKNYYTPHRHSMDPRVGLISRYAWGNDYHDLLSQQLRALSEFIQRGMGMRAKACVDTSAILEKLWAGEAGLGWQGKHSNLVSRDWGSWTFLGEVITDAELDADDPPGRDYCGTCTRCIDVCPTKAIVAPYVLDSRRCISYLTIEHRGPIPRDLRPLMGNLIFGCDLCLDVCPWNKFAKVTPEAAFMPREENLAPHLIELLELTREQFRERFRGSPVKRATYAGFLRNVCVALGNSGAPEAIPSLQKALGHSEPLVRGHAAWALGRLGDHDTIERHRMVESDASVLEEIGAALTNDPG